MNENGDKGKLDFKRWAITGVMAPFVVICIVVFVVAPLFWPELAPGLGSALGSILLWYLLAVVIAAAIWKIIKERTEKKSS